MANCKALPSADELLSVFSYNPETGELSRIHSKRKVGSRNPKGYLVVSYKGGCYPATRLIWMMVTGEDPKDYFIDHIDRNPHNNKWSNLRLASRSFNKMNGPHRGYEYDGKNDEYVVRIRYTVGRYKTPEEARKAYLKASLYLQGLEGGQRGVGATTHALTCVGQ